MVFVTHFCYSIITPFGVFGVSFNRILVAHLGIFGVGSGVKVIMAMRVLSNRWGFHRHDASEVGIEVEAEADGGFSLAAVHPAVTGGGFLCGGVLSKGKK